MLNFLISSLILIICLLLVVAFFTLAERKILGVVQYRRGPNVIGFYGLLQPISDGLKLLLKEPLFPSSADKVIFLIALVITFLFSLINWAVIPFSLYGQFIIVASIVFNKNFKYIFYSWFNYV